MMKIQKKLYENYDTRVLQVQGGALKLVPPPSPMNAASG